MTVFNAGNLVEFNVKSEHKFGVVLRDANDARSSIYVYCDEFDAVLKRPATAFRSQSTTVTKEQADLASRLTIAKGDRVKACCDEGEYFGVVTGVSAKSTKVITSDLVEYSFNIITPVLKLTGSELTSDPANPLDAWRAERVQTRIPYHDGGTCVRYKLFHKDKHVLTITEDAWGGEYNVDVNKVVDGREASELLNEDTITTAKQLGLQEERFFLFEGGVEVIAQYLGLERGLVSFVESFS